MPYASAVDEANYQRRWKAANRESVRTAQSRYKSKNQDKIRAQARKYYWALDPELRLRKDMLQHARRRAKSRGVCCNISLEDIVVPKICPITGVEMRRSRGRVQSTSPSLDCVIPQKGYVKGNVKVISHGANRLKSNATLEQLKALITYIQEASSGD